MAPDRGPCANEACKPAVDDPLRGKRLLRRYERTEVVAGIDIVAAIARWVPTGSSKRP